MAQKNVYRTELTPVSFLERSACVFPDKVAVIHGARRYTYRQFEERVNRLASALRSRRARQARPRRLPLPEHPRDARGALRRARGGRHPGGDQYAAQLGRDRLHPRPLGRELPLRRCRARRAHQAARPPRRPRGAGGRHRRARRSVRGFPRPGRDGARPELARGRGGDDRDQLHLGHDGPPEGRDVQRPRRVHERHRRADRVGHELRDALSLDAPHVPLQWLVLHVGGDGGGRHPRLSPAGGVGAHLGPARVGSA